MISVKDSFGVVENYDIGYEKSRFYFELNTMRMSAVYECLIIVIH
jgi:hypothetical protein